MSAPQAGTLLRALREKLDADDVGFLIKKPPEISSEKKPKWLRFMQQLFSGIYTVDNLDYVRRDAYMTGFSIDIVDIDRILFYSFFSKQGLTLHQAGVSAFTRFVNARLNLYSNVYFHRSGRAIDFHMQEIFEDTQMAADAFAFQVHVVGTFAPLVWVDIACGPAHVKQ